MLAPTLLCVQAKPGDIRLQPGDILLLDTGGAFAQQHRQSKHFALVIEMENTNPVGDDDDMI